MTEERYFNIDDESLANLTRKANLTFDIPKTGYNSKATNYVCSKIAEETPDCGFLDTTEWFINSKNRDHAQELVITACENHQNMVVGEICINPKEDHYAALTTLITATVWPLVDDSQKLKRVVVPLSISSEGKEDHGVALCLNMNETKDHLDIMILEQHAMRDGGALDYSQEIDSTLNKLKKLFKLCEEELGLSIDTFQNDKPICREKGVCGIVSTEVCRRLLQADDPMKRAKLGIIKINAEQVTNLHHQNFLNYQSDNNCTNYSRSSQKPIEL